MFAPSKRQTQELPMPALTSYLRKVLLADAVVSGAAGLAMIGGADFTHGLLGLPSPLLFWAGVALVPFVTMLALIVRSLSPISPGLPAACSWPSGRRLRRPCWGRPSSWRRPRSSPCSQSCRSSVYAAQARWPDRSDLSLALSSGFGRRIFQSRSSAMSLFSTDARRSSGTGDLIASSAAQRR